MLRKEIVRASQRLSTVLAPVKEFMWNMVRSDSGKDSTRTASQLLEVFSNYRETKKSFGDAEKEILKIFDLEPLDDINFWTSLLDSDSSRRTMATHEILGPINQITNFLPKLVSLLQRNHEITQSDSKKPKYRPEDVVTLMLAEDDRHNSSPKRVIDAISGLEDIYAVLAELEGRPTNDLALIGCDSGSDKSFDFLGAGETLKEFRLFFFDLWNRVVFFRELKHSEKLKQISETLPLVAKLGEMEQAGSLSPEKCEILRRQLVDGAIKLLDSGAMIPELQTIAFQDPKTLLAPAPTLLLEGPAPFNNPSTPAKEEKDGLSEAEQEMLDALLKKKNLN